MAERGPVSQLQSDASAQCALGDRLPREWGGSAARHAAGYLTSGLCVAFGRRYLGQKAQPCGSVRGVQAL